MNEYESSGLFIWSFDGSFLVAEEKRGGKRGFVSGKTLKADERREKLNFSHNSHPTGRSTFFRLPCCFCKRNTNNHAALFTNTFRRSFKNTTAKEQEFNTVQIFALLCCFYFSIPARDAKGIIDSWYGPATTQISFVVFIINRFIRLMYSSECARSIK